MRSLYRHTVCTVWCVITSGDSDEGKVEVEVEDYDNNDRGSDGKLRCEEL